MPRRFQSVEKCGEATRAHVVSLTVYTCIDINYVLRSYLSYFVLIVNLNALLWFNSKVIFHKKPF